MTCLLSLSGQHDLLRAVVRRGGDDAGEHEPEPDVGEVAAGHPEPLRPRLVPRLGGVGEEGEQRDEQERHVQHAPRPETARRHPSPPPPAPRRAPVASRSPSMCPSSAGTGPLPSSVASRMPIGKVTRL